MIDKRAAGNAAVIVVCPGKPASTLWHSSAVYHADTSHRSCDCPLNKERPVDASSIDDGAGGWNISRASANQDRVLC
ncbi:MAG: hypothetical protein U0075_05200 [Thermomicrobiales bacterium]